MTICEYVTFNSLKCVVILLGDFNDQKASICSCPIPCDVSVYVPSVSYGSTSNFDRDAFLQSESLAVLQSQFVAAREASQKVNPDIVRKDQKLTENFAMIVNEFSQKLQPEWMEIQVLNDVDREYTYRAHFHLDVGLKHLEFVVSQAFVRGWEVFEEGGVRFLANNYYDVLDSFDGFIQMENGSSPAVKEAAWFIVRDTLQKRHKLALRSIDNVTEAYNAFTDGHQLYRFKNLLRPKIRELLRCRDA